MSVKDPLLPGPSCKHGALRRYRRLRLGNLGLGRERTGFQGPEASRRAVAVAQSVTPTAQNFKRLLQTPLPHSVPRASLPPYRPAGRVKCSLQLGGYWRRKGCAMMHVYMSASVSCSGGVGVCAVQLLKTPVGVARAGLADADLACTEFASAGILRAAEPGCRASPSKDMPLRRMC